MTTEKEINDLAKRIARSGKHVLLIGPPGCGKTMVARRTIDFMNPGAPESISITSKIYRNQGLSYSGLKPPFRAPHHTISVTGLIGSRPDPIVHVPIFGEMSLAHGGILFLDELPEFSRQALDMIYQAMMEREVVHGTKTGNISYPANFLLVAAMNPCPCGRGVGNTSPCLCTSDSVRRYKKRVENIAELCHKIDLRCPEVPIK